jgi:hypothetical protein
MKSLGTRRVVFPDTYHVRWTTGSSMIFLTSKAPPSQHIKFDVPFLPQKYFPKTLRLTYSNPRVTWSTNRFNIQQDSQCTYNVILESWRTTIVAVEKQWVLYNLSVSVTLVNQHAMRMRHIAICGLPRSTIFFFGSHFLINGTIFE